MSESELKKRDGKKKRNEEEAPIFKKEDAIFCAENSDISRCSNRLLRSLYKDVSTSSSKVDDPKSEIQKTIEIGESLGFNMDGMLKELETNFIGQGVVICD